MGINTLIIDDDIEVANIIASTARILEIPHDILSDSSKLNDIDITAYNLIFLDLMMPNKDGVEVLRDLAELSYSGQIVLMSGVDTFVLSTAKNLAKARKLNVLTHLPKPFRISQIKVIFTEMREIRAKERSKIIKAPAILPDDILKAIFNEDYCMHYQPQIDLQTHKVIGLEALIRLVDEDGRLTYPDDFIPIAEEAQIINTLTKAVVQKSFSDFNSLMQLSSKLTLSINLSGLDLAEVSFCDWLSESAAEHGIPTDRVILEITETQKILAYAETLDILTRLRLKGFKISIDDFGTGSAVMDQIKQLPATELKIDKSFVIDMLSDFKSEILVKNTISLGKELSLEIVAEGIESKIYEKHLQNLGCRIGQGYYYSRPLPYDEVEAFLKNNYQP